LQDGIASFCAAHALFHTSRRLKVALVERHIGFKSCMGKQILVFGLGVACISSCSSSVMALHTRRIAGLATGLQRDFDLGGLGPPLQPYHIYTFLIFGLSLAKCMLLGRAEIGPDL
jgi:hypothetical protein